ncbi:hypothetical protein PV396_28100 [Streptomyces sp. ME02-8801-2C]|uniref:hypothetical protein n=1 Tax=Streptomyces sp. ME02-8801-2C TaxID=3028680 RepID=UPI0029BA1FD5|nr:hypothetical protein [Streptomyces sp. ME02-8801-2C]MDX3455755.1 hypothetical protein [Streptomyces sp. ME02-8801-2C]
MRLLPDAMTARGDELFDLVDALLCADESYGLNSVRILREFGRRVSEGQPVL